MLHSVSYEYGFIDIKKVRKIPRPVLEFYLFTGDMVVFRVHLLFPFFFRTGARCSAEDFFVPALAVAPKK